MLRKLPMLCMLARDRVDCSTPRVTRSRRDTRPIAWLTFRQSALKLMNPYQDDEDYSALTHTSQEIELPRRGFCFNHAAVYNADTKPLNA
jgi:hypothetical protein